jgi:penicillin-binding protein 1B
MTVHPAGAKFLTSPLWKQLSGIARRLRQSRRLARVAVVTLALVVVMLVVLTVLFVTRLRALRDLRATGPGWSFPSRLYTADFPLLPNAEVPPDLLRRELEIRRYRESTSSTPAPGEYVLGYSDVEIGLRGFEAAPDPAGHGGPERVHVWFSRGRLSEIRRLGGYAGRAAPDLSHEPRLEPMLFSVMLDSLRVRRSWIPLARIPKVVSTAVVASEDRRFRHHAGLDVRSYFRALFVNVRAGGVRQGGSTITQQLARGLFLGRERTLPRKLAEAALAFSLELALSKDEILEMYLNSVYWGQDGADGIGGIAEAARHYFGVPVEALTLPQAAMLAGIIPAPNTLSPFRNPELAKRSRRRVLKDLVEVGAITAAEAERANESPLVTRHVPPPANRFPAVAGFVGDELSHRLGGGAAEHMGLAVFTTVDPAWQQEAEDLLVDGLNALGLPPRGRAPLQGAFVALEPVSGTVRAMVGGRDAQAGDFNRAIQAKRQPGSAIKPIVYAAALDPTRGEPKFTPASTVPDLRRDFATSQGPWTPKNDGEEYHEQVTLVKALAKSLNVATANLVEAIGPNTVARYGERFGLGKLKAVASIGLGSNEVTPLALTSAYTVFANYGLRAEPTAVRALVAWTGRNPLPRRESPTRVIPAETATLMTGMLEDVVLFGVAYPLRKSYGFERPVAGKTGTTNDFNDAWFVGFTPQLVAGVWVGYDQPQSLGGPAAQTALRVWARIMTRLLDGLPAAEFFSDRGLEMAWIDPYSGGLARGDCPQTMRVPFLPGTAPVQACTLDHTLDWARIQAAAAAESTAVDTLQQDGTAPPPPDSAATTVP